MVGSTTSLSRHFPSTSSKPCGQTICSSSVGSGLSFTVMVMVSLSSSGPAFTIISKMYPPACVFVGVQENTPVSLLIVAPLGCFSRLNSTSFIVESVMLAVNDNSFVSSTFLFPIFFNSKT